MAALLLRGLAGPQMGIPLGFKNPAGSVGFEGRGDSEEVWGQSKGLRGCRGSWGTNHWCYWGCWSGFWGVKPPGTWGIISCIRGWEGAGSAILAPCKPFHSVPGEVGPDADSLWAPSRSNQPCSISSLLSCCLFFPGLVPFPLPYVNFPPEHQVLYK